MQLFQHNLSIIVLIYDIYIYFIECRICTFEILVKFTTKFITYIHSLHSSFSKLNSLSSSLTSFLEIIYSYNTLIKHFLKSIDIDKGRQPSKLL